MTDKWYTLEDTQDTTNQKGLIHNTCSSLEKALYNSGAACQSTPGGDGPDSTLGCCPQTRDKMKLISPETGRYYPLTNPYNTKIQPDIFGKTFNERAGLKPICFGTNDCNQEYFAEVCCREGDRTDYMENSITPTIFQLSSVLLVLILVLVLDGLIGGVDSKGKGAALGATVMSSQQHKLFKTFLLLLSSGVIAVMFWHFLKSSRYSMLNLFDYEAREDDQDYYVPIQNDNFCAGGNSATPGQFGPTTAPTNLTRTRQEKCEYPVNNDQRILKNYLGCMYVNEGDGKDKCVNKIDGMDIIYWFRSGSFKRMLAPILIILIILVGTYNVVMTLK